MAQAYATDLSHAATQHPVARSTCSTSPVGSDRMYVVGNIQGGDATAAVCRSADDAGPARALAASGPQTEPERNERHHRAGLQDATRLLQLGGDE